MFDLKLYAVSFLTILAVDYFWIGVVMNNFYVVEMRTIGRIHNNKFQPIFWSAMLVYLLFSIAIVQFALPRVASDSSWYAGLGIGGFLGFLIYAVYDFTNHSTLKTWSLALTIADILWGTVLGGIVTSVARLVRDI